MSQTPLVKLGTELSQGKVVAIRKNGVDIENESGVQTLEFTTVENEVLSNG